MKRLLYIISSIFIFMSCSTSQYLTSYSPVQDNQANTDDYIVNSIIPTLTSTDQGGLSVEKEILKNVLGNYWKKRIK